MSFIDLYGIFYVKNLLFTVYRVQKDNERQHVGTAARRDVACLEIAVHNVQSLIETSLIAHFRETVEQHPRRFLHTKHSVERRAVDDIGVVEVAHYAQQCLVEGIWVATRHAVIIERKPLVKEQPVPLPCIIQCSI